MANTAFTYGIKDDSGCYVVRFNNQHQVITLTCDVARAKRFNTHQAANRFRRQYDNAGYGLNNGTVVLIDWLNMEVPKEK